MWILRDREFIIARGTCVKDMLLRCVCARMRACLHLPEIKTGRRQSLTIGNPSGRRDEEGVDMIQQGSQTSGPPG